MNRKRTNLALLVIAGLALSLITPALAAGSALPAGEAGAFHETITRTAVNPAGSRAVGSDAPLNLSLIENQIVKTVNKQRTKKGLAPLVRSAAMTRAARLHSKDMRDTRTLFFTPGVPEQNIAFVWPGAFEMPCSGGIHEIPNSGSGIAYCAMHLFMKHSACDPMNNAPRLTILDPSLSGIGVGVKYGLSPSVYGTWYGYYITQNFS